MFQIIALPYEALKDLPPLEFKTLTALLRYVDKLGRCWPSLKQLAADVGRSEATLSRVMARLDHAYGVFEERIRREGGRYRYRIAARFLPRWPGKQASAAPMQVGLHTEQGRKQTQSKYVEKGRSRARFARHEDKQEEALLDIADQWRARIGGWERSGGKFWLPQWGPRPNERGNFVPPSLMAALPAG